MSSGDYFKIVYMVIAAAILFTFNSIFFLNLKAYNILNIVLFLVMASHIAFWFLDKLEKPLVFSIPISFLTFCAGINIQSKPKIFFFLWLLYVAYFCYYQFGVKKPAPKNLLYVKIMIVGACLCALIIFILLSVRVAGLLALLIASLLLAMFQAFFIVSLFVELPPFLKGGKK